MYCMCCGYCGHCVYCGFKLEENALFCRNCGAEVATMIPIMQSRSRYYPFKCGNTGKETCCIFISGIKGE